jgi:PKD repeat protein
VRNVGISTLNQSFTVGLYLSSDTNITTSDIFLTNRTVSTSLPAGQSNTANTTVFISTNIASGPYFLGAIADYTGLVIEYSEANNPLAGNVIAVSTSNQPPVASFVGNPTNGAAPLAVMFTDTSTGAVTNRFWNFGDGATSNRAAASVSHTYSLTSTNTVTLIVQGTGGADTNMQSAYIVVIFYPPGDVNGTFTVTGADSLLINQALVGLRSTNDAVFQITRWRNGDVNRTNQVTGADSLLINQVLQARRPYIVTAISPSSHSNSVVTPVTIYGIGFPTNVTPTVRIDPPVDLMLTNVTGISREQITAIVPAGGGIGTGTISVIFTTTNGVIWFGRFINQ